MKKIILLYCILFQFMSASSAINEDITKFTNQFNNLAKRFAYQEHFAWDSKVTICHELAALYKKLVTSPDFIKESSKQELAFRTYNLGLHYSTCGSRSLSYTTRKNIYQFKEWEDIEKLKNKIFKNTNLQQTKISSKEYCQKAVKNKQWDYIFFFTDEHADPNICPEALKLVEPHYSYAYKMRNWE